MAGPEAKEKKPKGEKAKEEGSKSKSSKSSSSKGEGSKSSKDSSSKELKEQKPKHITADDVRKFAAVPSGAGKDKRAKEQQGNKGGASSKPSGAPAARPAPKPKRPTGPAAPSNDDDYLAGIDLPSSGSDEEYEREEVEKAGPLVVQVTDRESKKLADKERLAMEKSLAARAEAMREDDNVFDVSFEGMGSEEATASATDVKVRCVFVCGWFFLLACR